MRGKRLLLENNLWRNYCHVGPNKKFHFLISYLCTFHDAWASHCSLCIELLLSGIAKSTSVRQSRTLADSWTHRTRLLLLRTLISAKTSLIVRQLINKIPGLMIWQINFGIIFIRSQISPLRFLLLVSVKMQINGDINDSLSVSTSNASSRGAKMWLAESKQACLNKSLISLKIKFGWR